MKARDPQQLGCGPSLYPELAGAAGSEDRAYARKKQPAKTVARALEIGQGIAKRTGSLHR